jgi:DNA invertase Pin-like site-specific DNA recombinase
MSTDRQSADSPADQIARCRGFAAARGWQIVEDLVVEEPAVSGALHHNRRGLLALMERIGEWDVLLAWDFSRLTRDVEDLG